MGKLTKIQRFLLWASVVGTFGETMLTPIFSTFVGKIGGGILEAGLGYAIFSLVTGFSVLYVGNKKWFSDNAHLVVCLGFLLSGIGDFLYFFVTGTVSLFLVQALTGLSVGLLNPACDSLYESEGEEDSFKWYAWQGLVSISIGISALVGSFITYKLGFKSMFVLSGLINGVAVAFAFMVYKNKSMKIILDKRDLLNKVDPSKLSSKSTGTEYYNNGLEGEIDFTKPYERTRDFNETR